MNKEEYFQFAEEFFATCISISKKKNSDYTGDASNSFTNFQAVESVGIASTEQGFLTRMMDKMMRINSFAKNGVLQMEDESVQDTLRDLANYSCLLAGWIKYKKHGKNTTENTSQSTGSNMEIQGTKKGPEGESFREGDIRRSFERA